MYDELIKRLRECTSEQNGEKTLWHQAADAIESTSKAYQMISEAYEAEVTKQVWIPVTERLPTGRDSVLALTGDCDIYVCDYIPSVKQFWTIPGDELHIDDITHWMPLPEPPESEGE